MPELTASVFRLSSAADAALLFGPSLAHHMTEHMHAAYLTDGGVMLAVDQIEGHSCHSVELPIRRLIGRALQLGGSAMVIAHNHPSGDPAPSERDIVATRALARAARALDIRLLDHLIFAGARCASFRALGLL